MQDRGLSPVLPCLAAGRIISEYQRQLLRESKLIDKYGRPLSVFIFNRYGDNRFKHSQFGLRVSTLNAAHDMSLFAKENPLANTRGFFEEYYPIVKNPYFIMFDLQNLTPATLAKYLFEEGTITNREYNWVLSIHGAYEATYNSHASNRLTEILKEKGFDCLAFMNERADPGSIGFIVFDESQLIPLAIDGLPVENSDRTLADSENEPAFLMPENDSENFVEKGKENEFDIETKSGIMKINNRNSYIGRPSAVYTLDVSLNARQQKILDALHQYDSSLITRKESVGMPDLAALTAKTGVEFAMFTRGSERLIIRGSHICVNVNLEKAKQLAKEGYKFSGHTHPGGDYNCLFASDGDYEILKAFNQKQSVIYNSKGYYMTYEL